ncbi:MAG: SUMF1/EgtB/PvdO family nonheme iron enzyme [Gammaproteobacteria bacterium]|nr:SUMF1/EgtB/PvdO family nonheme iron enzyme [Gammaproteobacteria bacterium]NIR97658.1 SUMF1/EgtB/PvdO family nonheme iron enzyme [Gammaproteobacteria bacterium]NIT63319.1 SUMF1/EgtB/PvdO family nonheme iron enzyme [Gammaproteobacteria bacterium]NIV20237.1 SUMF1/EgtB/PvdO family nonheme iron enzyme [Gammaproteobacteria bacterium]NIX10654.1 SUMF1/EgtB/PvdO family nonheme iron enzyme [Gammaproteobacteria bacterium]
MGAATHLVDKKILRSFVPLNGLSSAHFEEVAKKGVVEEYASGKYLFRQGKRDGQAYFLLSGEVTLYQGREAKSVVCAGTEEGRHPLAPQQPRQFSARANGRASVLRIDAGLLDVLLAWDQSSGYEVTELESEDEDDEDWMTRMLRSELFQRLPATNIQQMIMRMEEISLRAGKVVVEQDQEGDYFYIIKEGRCVVTRRPSRNARPVRIAELRDGDGFGEESLVSGAKRNATVTMVSDGVLMRLSKENFDALLREPLISQVKYEKAKKQVAQGAAWLDVRLPGEHQNGHLPGSINVPLAAIRDQLNQLDPRRTYIVYCDTATRSASAAFLLGQRGFDTYVLSEGLSGVPHEELSSSRGGSGAGGNGAEIIDFKSGRDGGETSAAGGGGDGADSSEQALAERQEALRHLEQAERQKRKELQALESALKKGRGLTRETERLNARLETAVGERDAARKEGEERSRALQAEHSRLEASLSEQTQARAEAERALSELRQQHEAAAAELEALRQERPASGEEVDQRLEELRRENSRLDVQLKEKNGALSALQRQLDEADSARETLEREHEAMRDAHAQGEKRTRELGAELERQREQVQALASEKAQLESERDLARSELSDLQSQSASADEQTRRRAGELERENGELRGRVEAAQRELEAAQNEAKQAEQNAREVQAANEQIERLRGELDELNTRARADAERYEQQRKELEEHRQAEQGLQQEVAALRERAQKELQQAGKELDQLRAERDELGRRAGTAEQELRVAEKTRAQMESELAVSRRAAGEAGGVQEELERLRAHMESRIAAERAEAETRAEQAQKQAAALREELERLRQQVARSDAAPGSGESEADHDYLARAFQASDKDASIFASRDAGDTAQREGRGRLGRAVASVLLLAAAAGGGYWYWKSGDGLGGLDLAGALSGIAETSGMSSADTGEPEPPPEAAPPAKPAVPARPAKARKPSPPARTEKRMRPGRVFRDRLKGGGTGPAMVRLPEGAFQMGGVPSMPHYEEHPRHRVRLSSFSIAMYEVTFAEYDRFAEATGRPKSADNGWGRGKRPVVNVSWEDAAAYARWLSRRTGRRYRLPTEAEWEYAARAGTDTRYWWGTQPAKGKANCYSCGSRWDGTKSAPVGSFEANDLGLHDMAGNASEWVLDCYHSDYSGAPADGSAWTTGACSERVARGGSYRSTVDNLRSSKRYHFAPDTVVDNLGFRVVREN